MGVTYSELTLQEPPIDSSSSFDQAKEFCKVWSHRPMSAPLRRFFSNSPTFPVETIWIMD